MGRILWLKGKFPPIAKPIVSTKSLHQQVLTVFSQAAVLDAIAKINPKTNQ
jgi:hypothetical protein